MQKAIGDQLARALLAGEVRDGDSVVVDLDDEKSGLSVDAGRGARGLTRRVSDRRPVPHGQPRVLRDEVHVELGAGGERPAAAEVMTWPRRSVTLPATQTPGTAVAPLASAGMAVPMT